MQTNAHFLDQIAQVQTLIKRCIDLPYHYHPRKLIHRHLHYDLYRYAAQSKQSIPLLIVFATINKTEILDLMPEHSFIGRLIAAGIEVYLLDWKNPSNQDQPKAFFDYVNALDDCTQFLKKKIKQDQVNVLGICQGGVCCVCYTALAQTIKNLILISTPIHFHTRKDAISKLLQQFDLNTIANMQANIPGAWLTQFFIGMRPFEATQKKYLQMLANMHDDAWMQRFMRVEKWLHDTPDQPPQVFMEFVKKFYQANKLIKGELYLSGKKIDLRKIKRPILNIIARDDEIVPPQASKILKDYVSSKDYTQRIFPSGHIGIYISDKVGATLPKYIAKWLRERE